MGFSIRRYGTTPLVVLALLTAALVPPTANAASNPGRTLTRALTKGIKQAGKDTGAYVVDLTTGRTLFSDRADTGRLPASVEKLYTTSTVLLRFGPDANLLTRVLGVGTMSDGVFTGRCT